MNTLVEDWRRFIRHGFRYEDFSNRLFEHLAHNAGFEAFSFSEPAADKNRFWHDYFEEGLSWLVAFIEQFGGHLEAVESFDDTWIDRSALNPALIDEMKLIYPALMDVLWAQEDEIYRAYKHYNLEMMQAEVGAFDTEKLANASEQYDRDFYYYGGQEIFDYDGVDDDLRDRLATAVASAVTANSADTLFEARFKQAPPTGSPSAQETLFATRRTGRRNHQRLTDATPQRESVPNVSAITPAEVTQYQSMRATL